MKGIKRYVHLYENIENWFDYLRFKWGGKKENELRFKSRSGVAIAVPVEVIREFKEIFMDEAYLKHLPATDLKSVVDIGANVGFFSLYAASKFPKARVIAYEPLPKNHNWLTKQKELNGSRGIVSHLKAVAGTRGDLAFFVDHSDKISTSAGIVPEAGRGKEITVPSVTLEDVFEENDLADCDLLKLDCEGAEFEILYSSPDHVLKRVRRLAIEVHETTSDERNTGAALETFLASKGFSTKREGKAPFSMLWAWQPNSTTPSASA